MSSVELNTASAPGLPPAILAGAQELPQGTAAVVPIDVHALRTTRKMTPSDPDLLHTMALRTPIPMRLSDSQGTYRVFNDAWCSLTGRKRDAEIENAWLDIVHDEDRAAVAQTYRIAIQNQSGFSLRYRLRDADGGYREILDRVEPWLMDDASFGGLVGSCIDLGMVARTAPASGSSTTETAKAAGDIATVQQDRDRFLRVLAHDLRTPLNGIQSWSHVLESQLSAAGQLAQRALTGIRTGVTQQVEILDSVVNASQIINGEITLSKMPFSVGQMIQSAVDSQKMIASGRRVQLEVEGLADELTVQGDPERLHEAIVHLLSNAIRFSPDGGAVRIRSERDGDAIAIHIEDDGEGLGDADVNELFKPFRGNRNSRRGPGLGLGLAVARAIVCLHGGDVVGSNREGGQGAIFTIHLPVGSA